MCPVIPPQLVVCALAGVVCCASAIDAAEPTRTPVGTARLDITPEYPVRLAGYGNRRAESAGVAQKLWAKALAIGGDEGEGPALWIAFENCGLTPAIRDQVAARLHERAHVRPERLALTATHTHTAPCLTGWAPFLFGEDLPAEHQARVDRYTQELTEKLVEVGVAALAARRPAQLSWGRGTVGFAVNRRVLKEGKWTGFGVQPDGPVDHRLPLLAARDESGKLVACVVNYACHCTTLGGNFNQICGDWAGFAQEFIEADAPGCVAMVTIGCGADANPKTRADDLEVCRQHGKALADEVRRVLASGLRPLQGVPQCRMISIDLPFAAPRTTGEWRERARLPGAPGYHARRFLAQLERGEKLPAALAYPVASWSFGRDLALVFLGGEVVVDYAIRMQTEFDADRLWITAYANDVPCYIPSRRILAEGGYEADQSMVYYARPQSLAAEVEELILDAVQKVLPPWFYSPAKQADFPPPRSPDESLRAIGVPPGFQVELVAAEPQVEDPVAFDWAPDGRLWVAEMADYPNGVAWDKPGDRLGLPGGRIKLLSDTDGDGRYDRATVFLDNVPFPNGVKSWRQGVLVTAAPSIFYAEDTDGDGVADRREVLFEGFGEGNQQHRANGLRWGVDNWLYVANGDSGGKILSTKKELEVSISGRDVRIRPDSGEIEAQSGQTQFGRCRDDWGNWFGGNNANPLWHYVLDDRYLRRNPDYAPPAVRRDVPEVRGAAPVFPLSRTLARFNDFHTANRFTSACSPEIYRDEWLFPAAGGGEGDSGRVAGHVFICEPVHNLVHHEVLETDGVSFRSRRPEGERQSEFFASADNWCRPVMVRTGPDGALWIADMYRQVIEHPEWIPATWQRKLDLRAGKDRGRIYRVVPVAKPPRSGQPWFHQLDVPGLIERLHSPNGWQRDMAQQQLIWRNDLAAVPGLEQLVKDAPRPTARLHALGTLDGLGQLSSEILRTALRDRHPGVRRHAVLLAEARWQKLAGDDALVAVSEASRLENELLAMVDDPDPFVRQQLACTLGSLRSGGGGNSRGPSKGDSQVRIGRALGTIALRDASNPYLVAAVMSSIHRGNAEPLVDVLAAADPPPWELTTSVLALAGAMGETSLAGRLLAGALGGLRDESAGTREARWNRAAGLLETLARNREAFAGLAPPVRQQVAAMAHAARAAAVDPEQPVSLRVAAVRLLGAHPDAEPQDKELFPSLLAPQHAPELQSAALSALAARFPSDAATLLLAEWRCHSPGMRAQILDTLLTKPSWTKELVAALEAGSVPAADLDARRRQQLVRLPDRSLRERAERVWGAEPVSGRADVWARLQHVADRPGDAPRGKLVFTKKCAACHLLEDTGQNVGPDLTTLTDKSPRTMLAAILDPNRAVETRFLDYLAVTTDGRQFTGMIVDETSSSVTLAGQEGKRLTLLRSELEVLQSTGKSLMPEGLEKDLTEHDLADVIAYVRSVSKPPKQFPGNRPEPAQVRDDGSIRLLAMQARIYGTTLEFEETYRNLGQWRSADDHAVWVIQVPRSGPYRVAIEYACADAAAGNRFVIATGSQTLGGNVVGTGSWDVYRSHAAGRLELTAGDTELLLRADGAPRHALMDLRQIVLYPE